MYLKNIKKEKLNRAILKNSSTTNIFFLKC